MSTAKHGTGEEVSQELVDAPFVDDLERTESAWLIARDADPAAPAPSPALQREHEELEDLLGSLPPMAEDDGWQKEVLRRAVSLTPAAVKTTTVPASPKATTAPTPAEATTVPVPSEITTAPARRRKRAVLGVAGAALAAAAVVTVMLLRPDSRTPTSELEIEIRHGAQVRGDARGAAVGDRLVIRGRALRDGDLRVFRADGALVGRCPDGPGCTVTSGGERSLEVTFDQPVPYRLIFITGVTRNLPMGTRDEYLDAVRATNARIEQETQIDVN